MKRRRDANGDPLFTRWEAVTWWWVLRVRPRLRRALKAARRPQALGPWLAGLRVTTRAERDRMAAHVKTYQRVAAKAEAEKRNAYRMVAVISEPLKDWDLNDFPTTNPAAGPLVLDVDDVAHLREVVQVYRTHATDLAHIRVSAKVNDRARRRGYDDVDLDSPAAQRALLEYRREQRLENPRTLP